jgi:flagellar biosynthesis/type III secretory pathway M-ring protein FliF/YscJ
VDLVLAIVVLVLAVAFVVAPLRRGVAESEEASVQNRRADLEAAKESKYREIRDAELDYRTGKLSEADWRSLDRELRHQAIELLRQIDELGERVTS